MQVSVESTSTLGRKMTVVVPADRFEQEFSQRLQRLSRQVKLPGFRPGKVPAKVVEQRYSGQLLEETAEHLIQHTLSEAIGEQQLRPAAGPRVQLKPPARGQELEYTAEFEVLPEIGRLDLAGIEIEKPVPEVADSDVERMIENLRRQRVEWKPVQREAKREDRVMIDFTARVDGNPLEGGTAQNQPVVLGAGTLFPEIEEGLVGARAGDTRQMTVNFPADANPSVAGKAVEFEVRVNEVAEPVLPEVNDEFAQALGIAEGGVAKLREEIRASLEREANERARTVVRRNVLKALRDANPVEVPEAMVASEASRMQRLSEQAGGGAGLNEEAYRDRARVRVALGLILAEVVRARQIKADPARVRERIEQMARDYQAPEKFIEWYYANPERLAEIESQVLEEQVVEQLLGTAQVRERPVSFPELLQMDVSIE